MKIRFPPGFCVPAASGHAIMGILEKEKAVLRVCVNTFCRTGWGES